jgi:hypothetical protein
VHQIPLAAYVLIEQQKNHFQDDHRVHGFIAVIAVKPGYLLANESEVDLLGNATKGVFGPNALIEVNVVAEEILLRLMSSHHGALKNVPARPDIQFFAKETTIWATRPLQFAIAA